MDYELKYVIAICLVVKIAALSPEFSVSMKTEKSKQISDPVEKLLLSPADAQAVSGSRLNQRMLFTSSKLGQEKSNEMEIFYGKDVAKTKKIKENQSFDTCEHKLKLLKSSLKWRDIQKTLHWLNRILASNQTNAERCHNTKELQRTSGSYIKNQNIDFRPSNSKKRDSTNLTLNRAINLKTSFHSRLKKKFKKKHRTRKNESRKGRNKKENLKSQPKHSYDKGRFRSKSLYLSPLKLNNTIRKPNSVFLDLEKILFKQRKIEKCRNSKLKIINNCQELKSGRTTDEKSEEMTLRKHEHERNTTKVPKQKPWPHFVYHRVSSKFFHPDSASQKHSQSAYIAISVVTASKPESTDDNVQDGDVYQNKLTLSKDIG